MAGYIQEASPEVRESAKDCFLALGRDIDRVISKYLTENVLKSVKDIIEKEARKRTTGKSETKRRSISLKSTPRRTVSRNPSNRIKINSNFERKNSIKDTENNKT